MKIFTKFIYLFLFVLMSNMLNAQISLISPTGDGGFETGTTFALNNWTAANSSITTRVWYAGTGQTGYTGTRCALIGNSATNVGTSSSTRIVHLYRSVTIPAGAENISLSFKYKQATADNTYDFLKVFYNANTPVYGTAQTTGLLLTIDPPSTSNPYSSFTTVTTTIPNSFAGATNNLIFTFNADNIAPHGYGAIDDVSLTYTIPSCVSPTALVSSAITTNSATISWAAASPAPSNGYEYYLSTSNTAPTAATAATGTTSAGVVTTNLSSLNPSTTYYFWVRSVCGASDKSTWAGSATFATLCNAVTTFTQNFDAVTTPAFPACWAKVGASGGAYTYTSSPSSAPNCLYIYAPSTTDRGVVAMPPVSNAGANTHRLRFKIRGNFTAGETIHVGYLTNPNDATTFVTVQNVVATALIYNEVIVDLGTAPGTNQVLAFRNSGTLVYSTLIDDVIWEPKPTCNEPTALAVSNITATSTDLAWTAPTPVPANGYEYYVSTTNTAPTAATVATGTSAASPANITGLTATTTYYVWVRAICGAGDISIWSAVRTFTTLCSTVTNFTQNFDAGTAIPTCYAKVGTTGTINTQTSGALSAPNCMYIYGSSSTNTAILALQPVSNAGTGTHRLRFKARAAASTGGVLQVGFLTNPTNPATFTAIQSFTTTSTTVYDNFICNSGTSAGVNQTLAFRHTGSPANSILIDDVIWEPIPTCNEPTALALSNITSTSANIAWTAPTPVPTNGYEYYVSTTNTAPIASTTATGTSAASPANITGLTSATTYYVWARAICGAGDISIWSAVRTFTTLCDAIPIVAGTPWIEGFETPVTPAIPNCWAKIDGNADGDAWVTTITGPRTGLNCARIFTDFNTSNQDYFITPQLVLPSAPQRLRFWVKANSTTEVEEISVKLATNAGTAIADYTTVLMPSTPVNTTSYVEKIIDLTAYANQTIRISFVRENTPVDGWYLFLDDIKIEDLPTTDISTDALVTAGCYSATQTITVRIKNSGIATVDFALNNATVSTVVSGAATATLSGTVNTGTLAPGATLNVDMSAPINMSVGGVYNFACSTTTVGDQNTVNDALASQSRTAFSNGAITQTVSFTGFTGSNLGTVATGWIEAKNTGLASTPAVNTISTSGWTSSTAITAQGTTTKINLYSTGYKEWILSPIMPATASSVLTYKVAITDASSAAADPSRMQGTDDEVKVMVSTDCGTTWTALQTFNAASTTTLSNTFVGYSHSLAAYAGQNIMVGFYASEGTVANTPDYDFHLDDINIGESCTGTPTAGTVTGAASRPLCSGVVPAVIAVTGSTIFGVTYQWEQSLDDGVSDPWIAVTGGTGATNTTYTPPTFAGTSIFYRLKVTCTASGLFAATTSVNLTLPTGPSTPATNVLGTITSLSAATITWTNGNGGRRFVAINTVNSFTDPVGLGDINLIPSPTVYLGSGEQIVYDGTGSTVSVTGLTQGVTYYARVYEYLRCSANNNYYNISTTALNPSIGFKPDAPANDNISNATTLAIGTPCTTAPYTVLFATTEIGEPIPACWVSQTLDRSVWFKFIAPASGNDVTVSTDFAVGTLTDSQIGVYGPFNAGTTPDMSSLGTAIACDDDGGVTGAGYMSITTKKGLEPGATYYIQVDRYASTSTAGTFCIQVSEGTSNTALVAPTVATCTNAPSVSIGSSNNNVWVPIYTSTGALVAAINGNGNILGVVTASYYTTTANRTDASGVHYLGRNFGITVGVQPAVGTPASVRLYYTDAEMVNLQNFDPSASNANVNVTHVPGGSCLNGFVTQGFVPQLIVPGASDRLDFGTGAYMQFQTPSFSSFFIHRGSAPLPIELKTLSAKENGKFNTVLWETAIEDNVDYFIVEKSENGFSWSNAGRVYPNASKRYSFDDKTPFATTYYRLKNVDKDAREATSKSVVVERQTGKFNITSIAPNPTQGDLTVKFETTNNDDINIHILDIFGKIVLNQKVAAEKGINTVLVNTSNLPIGAYFISLNNGEKTLIAKMVKQ